MRQSTQSGKMKFWQTVILLKVALGPVLVESFAGLGFRVMEKAHSHLFMDTRCWELMMWMAARLWRA